MTESWCIIQTQHSTLNTGNRNEDEGELSLEESENEEGKLSAEVSGNEYEELSQEESENEEVKKSDKHKVTRKRYDHKDNLDFQDTSIVESTKGDYSGTRTQTIRFDDDDADSDSESETNSESENDEVNSNGDDHTADNVTVKEPIENSTNKQTQRRNRMGNGGKTNRRKAKRERISEPTGPKEHDELREKIRLAGMAVVARGKIDGPTSTACTLL